MSQRIRSIRTQEIFGYADYPVTFTMFEVFGFGKPVEHRCLMELPGVQTSAWGPPVQLVADQLGVELSEIRETYDKRVTDRTLEVAAGTIEAGTVGAVRFETIGVVDGRDAIVIEHINRMAPDLAPEWPTADRDGTYRIMIDGEPSLSCDLQVGTAATYSHDGMVATTMRVVNAIPFVCDAAPGIVDRDRSSAHAPASRVRSLTRGLLALGLVRIVEVETELIQLRLVDLEHFVERLVVVELIGVLRPRRPPTRRPAPRAVPRAQAPLLLPGPGLSLRLGLTMHSSCSARPCTACAGSARRTHRRQQVTRTVVSCSRVRGLHKTR